MLQRPWRAAIGELRLMECAMVRGFPLRRGRRLAPGWWWSATTGRLVGYGSAAMRDAVMMLDQNPQVAGMVSRPLEFVWEERGRIVTHTPDLAVSMADGGIRLVDCPGSGGPSARLVGRARVVGACARDAGWEHRFADTADPVVLANARWLSVYRHPRCSVTIPASRLRAAFAKRVLRGGASSGHQHITSVFSGINPAKRVTRTAFARNRTTLVSPPSQWRQIAHSCTLRAWGT
ncbi:TnsA-like heteromeric transposase endonuclease subunit [Streptomyces sp. NPDC058290]|uniref:TnsA-like heteromeric transposase endonuclease subunit n=1 Tax=Streptomyces sp. NPDC058290 TaxID=3346426 RepID=UPI0036E2C66B